MDDRINKMRYIHESIHPWNLIQPQREMKYCHVLPCGWTLKTWRKVKEDSYQRPNIIGFHSYELSRISKSIDKRKCLSGCLGLEERGDESYRVWFLLGTLLWTVVIVAQVCEIHQENTLNEWILWHMSNLSKSCYQNNLQTWLTTDQSGISIVLKNNKK